MEDFKSYIEAEKQKIEKLRAELLHETVCSNPPQIDPNTSIDLLLYNKLRLESEIESLLSSDAKHLPDNDEVLLNLAKESSKTLLNNASRALEYQKEINMKLIQEKKNLAVLLENAESVEAKLGDLINSRSDVDYVASLKHKYSTYGSIFQELREEFGWYLGTRFSSEDSNNLSLEEVLETCTKQFLKDPNNAYVEFDEANMGDLAFLIRANVIIRHPIDYTKYKLMDFRRD